MKYTILAICLALLVLGAFSVALADNNLCHTVWAGQCETEAQWQAGHCYANQSAEVCDTIYGDVVSSSSDESTGGSSQGGGQSEGATAQSAGQTQQYQGLVLKSAEQLSQEHQQRAEQQQQQQQQQNTCTPGISYSGVSGNTYSFTVSTCGKPLSEIGDWTLAAFITRADSSDGLCNVGVYHSADAYGNHIGNQLYWARADNCYENNKSASVSG